MIWPLLLIATAKDDESPGSTQIDDGAVLPERRMGLGGVRRPDRADDLSALIYPQWIANATRQLHERVVGIFGKGDNRRGQQDGEPNEA